MSVALAVGTLIKLFLLLTPFFVLSVFVTTCSEMSPREQKSLAMRTTVAVVFATLVLYLFGNLIFTYLGITLDAFRIGAGLVLLLNGIDMVRGSGMPKNRDVGASASDPAVVPLAIPTTVGPGTIGTMLVMGAETGNNVRQRIFESIAIACAGILVGILLYFSRYLKDVLKDKGLSVLTKLTGMYIVALAAQIIFDGINGMFRTGFVGELLQILR